MLQQVASLNDFAMMKKGGAKTAIKAAKAAKKGAAKDSNGYRCACAMISLIFLESHGKSHCQDNGL